MSTVSKTTKEPCSLRHSSTKRALVIGSSPLLCIKAAALRKQGWKVSILDERERIGGAWFTQTLWGCDQVEVGCHYLEPRIGAYRFLNKLLDCPVLEMKPQPLGLGKGIWAHRERWVGLLAVFSAVKRRDFKRAARNLPNLLKKLTFPDCYQYPAGGCGSIISGLEKLVSESGCEIRLGRTVRHLDLDLHRNLATCTTDDGIETAERVVIGASTRLDSLSVNGQEEKLRYTSQENCHVVFRIRGEKARAFSFVNIFFDPFVCKISDVTSYAKNTSELNGDRIIVAQFAGATRKEFSDSELASAIFQQLLFLKILKQDATLVSSQVFHFDYHEIQSDQIEDLRTRFSPLLWPLATRNLNVSVDDLLKRCDSQTEEGLFF
jgi:hypothetical protein